jgi:hypothetical protein
MNSACCETRHWFNADSEKVQEEETAAPRQTPAATHSKAITVPNNDKYYNINFSMIDTFISTTV